MVGPDWDDNPPSLDTTEEVRTELIDDGLNPMDIDTPEQATFGHSLVHAFADDENRGGRSPEQLEAEHDMTVDAMEGFGIDHETELDLMDIR